MGIAIAAFSAAFVAHKKGGFGTRQRAGATWRALNSFVESKRWKDVNPNTISTKQIRAGTSKNHRFHPVPGGVCSQLSSLPIF